MDSPQSHNTQTSDPVPPTVDLLNPNSEASTQYRGLLLCKVSSHSDEGFSFYRANKFTPTYTHTHIVTVIAISAQPYYVVGVDNYC